MQMIAAHVHTGSGGLLPLQSLEQGVEWCVKWKPDPTLGGCSERSVLRSLQSPGVRYWQSHRCVIKAPESQSGEWADKRALMSCFMPVLVSVHLFYLSGYWGLWQLMVSNSKWSVKVRNLITWATWAEWLNFTSIFKSYGEEINK